MKYQDYSDRIINYLLPYQPERIGVFGSFARNEQTSMSDLDILMKLNVGISLFDLVQIQDDLTNIVGRKVHLLTEGALKNRFLKKSVEEDLILIYGSKK